MKTQGQGSSGQASPKSPITYVRRPVIGYIQAPIGSRGNPTGKSTKPTKNLEIEQTREYAVRKK